MVEDEQGSTVLRRLINRTGEPFVRIGVGAAMRLMGEVFVMGRTIEEDIERMRSPKNNGFKASFDMLGEADRTFADAEDRQRVGSGKSMSVFVALEGRRIM